MGEQKVNNLTQKAKIAFIAGGVCLIIGLITGGWLWYIGTLVLGIIGLVDVFKKQDSQQATGEDTINQRTENEENMKECPFCAEKIKQNAKICRFCGREITS
jgi:flagellar biosynthesis component FlhA